MVPNLKKYAITYMNTWAISFLSPPVLVVNLQVCEDCCSYNYKVFFVLTFKYIQWKINEVLIDNSCSVSSVYKSQLGDAKNVPYNNRALAANNISAKILVILYFLFQWKLKIPMKADKNSPQALINSKNYFTSAGHRYLYGT